MAMTDEQVLEKLQAIRATSVPVGKSSGRSGPKRVIDASPGGSRRSDAEVAQAILAIDLALASPAVQAVMAGDTPPTRTTKAKSKAAAPAMAGASAVSAGSSFCQIYGEVKDYIDIALEALDWVPYGSTIAKVVRLLEKVADRACR